MIDFCIQCDDGTKMQYGVKDLTSSVKNLSVTVLAVKVGTAIFAESATLKDQKVSGIPMLSNQQG